VTERPTARAAHSELPELAGLPAVLEHENRKVLAIPIGMGRNEFALAKLAEVRNKPGWIVRDGTVSEWRVEGFFKHEETLYLFGPYLAGRFLEQELARAGVPAVGPAAESEVQPAASLPGESRTARALPALRVLGTLIKALLTLQGAGHPVEELQTDAVCFLEEDGVLFLPPELMHELRDLRPEKYRLLTYQSLNHPELRGSADQLSFALAVLLHRLLRGSYPFEAATEEELRNRIRYQKLSPLVLTLPGLREEISQAILRGLHRAEGPAPTLEQWLQLLGDAAGRGPYRQLDLAEQEAIGEQARRQQARATRAYRNRVFWQRHWKTVLIVVAAAAAIGGLGGSFLKNLLAPRLTRGFTPRQVVESFYGGMNTLDHALMEDCVVGRAGKETIREVISVYVLSRVSLGYEGKSHIVRADQWVAEGRPKLPPTETVYGVTDLEIRQERGAPEPVFLASYTKWVPTPGNDGENSPPDVPRFTSQTVRERLYLRQDRRDWVIHRIQRL
jgi:hypothetical protein